MSGREHAVRRANFDRVIAAYGPSDAIDGILDRWRDDHDSEPFLLVQVQPPAGTIWYATFEIVEALEAYADDESEEGWNVVAVVDLDAFELLDVQARTVVRHSVDAGERRPFEAGVAR